MPIYTMPYRWFLGLLAALPCVVNAVQPDAGQLLNEQQRLQQRQLEAFPQDPERHAAPPAPNDIHGVSVRIRAFRFSGDVGVVGEAQLQTLLRDAIGREFDFNGLQGLADRVSTYLKGKGYFLAYAYLPKQVLTSGVIEIALLAGRLESSDKAVDIQGRLRISPQRLELIAESAVKPGEVVRQKDLERAVLLINDVPGVSALSNVERGSEPGTVHLVVDATEGPLLSGEVGLDNHGNRYTGQWRGNAQLNVNDPLRIGDRLLLSLVASDGMQLEQFSYDWPVNFRGLRASVSYGDMDYTIGKDLSSLNASGTTSVAGGGISYPIIRSRSFNLWSYVNYASKALRDDAFGEAVRNKHINAWSAVLSGDSNDRLGGGGLNNFYAALTSGNLDLSKVVDDLALDQASGARTEGQYEKLDYSLARLQRISDRLSLFAALNGQHASKNLDSSEKFILGGPSGVRAYPIGEGAGDQGFVANIELRYDLPMLSALGHWQWVGFIDTGRISLHKSPWPGSIDTISGDNSYKLSGVGMGFNLTQARSYAVRTAWATKIGSNRGRSSANLNSDGLSDDSQFWLYGVLWL
jgi:hemolysin activation/secretion protein